MGFVLRMEQMSALAELEVKEKQASEQGSAAYETFKEDQIKEAIQERTEMGDGGDTSSSDSGSDDSADDTSSDDSDSGGDDFGGDDSGSDDTSEEPPEIPDETEEPEEEPEEEAEEEEEEEPEEEEETELKKESFRQLSFIPEEDQHLRLEGFGEMVSSAGTSVWTGLSFVIGTLASVGIKYTPMLLSGMFKVVLFTFAKTFKVLDEFYGFMETTVVRYLNRTTKQKASIEKLRETVKALMEKQAAIKEGAVLNTDVRFLIQGESNDIDKNVAVFTSFADDKIAALHRSLLGDFSDLEMISRNRYLGKSFDALKFMRLNPEKAGFKNMYGSIEDPAIQFNEYGMGAMIGNVEVCAKLSSDIYDNWMGVEKAYAGSKIYVVPRTMGNIGKAPLMTPGELVGFLNNLELLAEVSLNHQIFYDEIKRSRSDIMTSIKQMFVRLFEEKVKVSFKDSVTLPLYLKSSFATKVYLTGALDIHDHIAQVIANGLSYSSEMLKLYQVKS